ncbi:hypothetical protein [Dolichospermum flos-aquae]|uniref:hypothetical protein n=1 Tax=Dolichospermum flosaquae TaxID=1166 RepID=UPI001B38F579|nr:hypothetical protein [Dolichospermum flos-aquae]
MKKIIWFTNSHEHRNHLLKYGLMKLARQRKIEFIEQDNSHLLDYNLPLSLKNHTHRHTNLLMYINGNKTIKILVDSEDSFVHLCPLIEDVDIYFCAAYNHDFHVEKKFIQKYDWQTNEDVAEYEEKSRQLISDYNDHFCKINKFIPIGFNLSHPIQNSYLKQKVINIRHKITNLLLKQKNWASELEIFEARYNYVNQLRHEKLLHDVVLYDTLWGGWPQHRYNLHVKLQDLSQQYNISSVLKWDESANQSKFIKEDFPVISHPIHGNYEEMLAASRLGVFATGFHWGWRNIMTLTLFFGIPIYMDKPIFEPYFDFDEFQVFYNDGNWQSLESCLNQIDDDSWIKTKQHNQSVYDKYLAPEKVAEYFIKTIDP